MAEGRRCSLVSRSRALVLLAAVAVALGVGCLGWAAADLPLRGLVRGHLGDVFAVAFLYAALGLALPWRAGRRVALAAGIAVAIEVAQARGGRRGVAGELVLGAHFDPWDLCAYALGLAAAWQWERVAVRRGARAGGGPGA